MTREPFSADLSQLATEDVFSGLVERARGGCEAWEVEEGKLDGGDAICNYQATDGGPADHGVGAAERGQREAFCLERLRIRVNVCFSVRIVV